MGLWGGLKGIGRGIGRGVKKVGKVVGKEVKRAFDPIVKGVKGDWKGALAGIGHNIKRGAQVAAVLGTGGVAGVGLGAIGAAGGAIEGGFKEGGGGFKDIIGGGISGYGGVQTGKALGNIGRNVAGRVGSRGAEAALANTTQGLVPGMTDAALQGGALPNVPVRDMTSQLVTGGGGINMPSVTSQVPLYAPNVPVSGVANVVGGEASNIGKSIWGKAGGYLDANKGDLLKKAAGQFMGGNQPAGDEYYPGGEEPMMDPREMQALERERLYREMMMRGPQSRWA